MILVAHRSTYLIGVTRRKEQQTLDYYHQKISNTARKSLAINNTVTVRTVTLTNVLTTILSEIQ